MENKKYKISLFITIITIIALIIIGYLGYGKYNELTFELAEQTDWADYYRTRYNEKLTEISNTNSKIRKFENQIAFMDKYIAICIADGTSLYHTYNCIKRDDSLSFMIMNKELAENEGFKPCSVCQKNTEQTKYTADIVYITNTGEKYHREWCSYLKSKNPIDLEKAKQKGYEPCSRCNP